MAAALEILSSRGVRHIVFGDLHLADIRTYRERQLAASGMSAIFPLWARDTRALAKTMLASGIEAYISRVDTGRLDGALAGRRYDEAFLRELPPDIDPCGENGEFHTVVCGGPMFHRFIKVRVAGRTERDGQAFADIEPIDT